HSPRVPAAAPPPHPPLPAFPTRRSSDLVGPMFLVLHAAAPSHPTAPLNQRKSPARPLIENLAHPDAPAPLSVSCAEGLQHDDVRSEEHTSERQSRFELVCRPLPEKKHRS